MDIRRVAGGIGLTAALLLAILLGSDLVVFINTPSIVISVLGGLAAWWAMCGRGVPALITTLRSEQASASDLAAGLHTVRAGKRAFWMVGVSGTLIGFVQMLQALDDPSAIGPATAVAFLTIFYALLVDLFLLSPMAAQLQLRRCAEQGTAAPLGSLDQDLAPSREAMDALRRRASQNDQRIL
jgi:flagellar motor component MotA